MLLFDGRLQLRGVPGRVCWPAPLPRSRGHRDIRPSGGHRHLVFQNFLSSDCHKIAMSVECSATGDIGWQLAKGRRVALCNLIPGRMGCPEGRPKQCCESGMIYSGSESGSYFSVRLGSFNQELIN